VFLTLHEFIFSFAKIFLNYAVTAKQCYRIVEDMEYYFCWSISVTMWHIRRIITFGRYYG